MGCDTETTQQVQEQWQKEEEQTQHKQMVVLLDIDNTLYNDKAVGSLSMQMRVALIEYVQNWLKIPFEEAKSFVEKCFKQYGLTICGLVHEKTGIEPEHITDFVYSRCDFTGIKEDVMLREMLSRLRSEHQHRLYYLTNAPRRHATTVLERLGLTNDEFALEGFSYEDQWAHTKPVLGNKPMRSAYSAIYNALKERHPDSMWIEPYHMVMVDDAAHNLLEPLAMGWSAVWVAHGAEVPDVLLTPMKSGRLVCVEHIGELEDAIHRLSTQKESAELSFQ
ncbi:HAD family hydrolase [Trypanosoma theileri]|uniref:HAD family hydrolase n=1 Tax=Trypanosoma theileri TaxID=67003 RepID=A0A1X0P7P0_9TRYP|nr:HAD family hydrolase [Trypanosoma theileri]ORC92952.1 HAD family hydrolase [Trypanosoma theileri]